VAIFSVQAIPTRREDWLGLARRCEAEGFDALLAADHPGAAASPFVALAAVAGVTSRIGLGSYVANAGVHEPMLLASDVATLDVVSGGRARLGIGAGHTPAEWQAVGRERPGADARVRRCEAVARAVGELLDGKAVTVETDVLTAYQARLAEPRPVQGHIPLTVGTANSRLLRWAGAHADIVGLIGSGRTLADGHTHELRWHTDDIDAQVEQVAIGAAHRADGPAREALVQLVAVTDDAEAAVEVFARHTGLSAAQVLATPFVLAGTAGEIAAAVEEHERRWGITRYVVRDSALDALAPLLPQLAG
jgi:probable F420-dependent oxidoreductase